MSSEFELFSVQQPSQAPLPPPTQERWSPQLRFLLVALSLLGVAATLFSVLGKPIGRSLDGSFLAYVESANQAGFILNIPAIVICVVGVFLVGNVLLRAAFVLTIVTRLAGIVAASGFVPLLFHLPHLLADKLFTALFWVLSAPVQLGVGALGLLTSICLSYGLARWRSSDRWSIWVQLLLTLVVGFVLLQSFDLSLYQDQPDALLLYASSPFLGVAGLACLLVRPACWKAQPLLVGCFTFGGLALLLFNYGIERLIYAVAGAYVAPHVFIQISNAIGLVGSTFFMLGLLLLIQDQRLHKNAPSSLPAAP